MKIRKPQKLFAWLFIPTLYFAQGLPYILVNVASVIMYKNLGVSNTLIGVTSLFYLPWVLKPLWSPVVEMRWTTRQWILAAQILLAAQFVLIAFVLHLPYFFVLSMVVFVLIAFSSATHDIAIDGYYMLVLNDEQQAFYVGVRSTFYRVAMIFGSGVLVILAGKIGVEGREAVGWLVVMLVSAAIFGVLFLFHSWYLPQEKKPPVESVPQSTGRTSFAHVFKTYFQKQKIVAIVVFILLYRLGEAMLVKMAAPFLLDAREAGGLALSTEAVGFVYGTVGVLCLVAGGILGGWLVAKFGLRKCMWPLAFALNLPNLVYVYLSHTEPSFLTVQICVAIEQFGYGLGFAGFMVFLMYTAEGPYKTAHYALSTGFMALGMMLPGLVSGFLQSVTGYPLFFIIVSLLPIPGMLLIFFVPLEKSGLRTN